MARRLKVFSGKSFVNGKQMRTIVSAYSKKRAMEVLKVTSTYFNNYWHETTDKHESDVALNKPEAIFILLDSRNNFTELKRGDLCKQ